MVKYLLMKQKYNLSTIFFNFIIYIQLPEIIKIKYRIERSEFIGFIEDCKNADDINNIVKIYKKKYYDARQICYGVYIDDKEYFSDDKEPTGTAGYMILNELKKNDIKNKIIIVVRYFGGIKLGKDGLKNSYSNVSKMLINKI